MRYFFAASEQITASGLRDIIIQLNIAELMTSFVIILLFRTWNNIVKRVWLGKTSIYQIVYDNGLASFIGQAGIKFTTFDYDSTEFEVVGNIYDNKLEGF